MSHLLPHPSPQLSGRISSHTIDPDCKDRVSGVINFVTGNLRPVKSETDQELSHWYQANSLVYVAADHACWSDEDLAKKVLKRRFGNVKKSSEVYLNRMMETHAEVVREWILERLLLDDGAGGTGDSTEDDRT